MPNDINYTTIVSQSIIDFNAIFDALAAKSILWNAASDKNQSALPSTATGSGVLGTAGFLVNSGISTADYAGLIRRQLFRISGINTLATPDGVANGILASYAGSTVTGNTNGISISASGITVSLPQPGYYTTGSSIFISSVENIAVDGTLTGSTPAVAVGNSLTTENGTYVVRATENRLLNKVAVDIGSDLITQGDVNLSGISATPSIASIGGGLSAASLDSAADVTKYSITFAVDTTLAGTVTSTVNSTFTPGYITAIDSNSVLTKSKSFGTGTNDQTNVGTTVNYAININKASISGIRGQAGIASLTPSYNNLALSNSSSAYTNYYTLTATPSVTVDLDHISVTEGYIKSTDTASVTVDTSNTTITPSIFYLKQGSLPNYTNNDILNSGIVTFDGYNDSTAQLTEYNSTYGLYLVTQHYSGSFAYDSNSGYDSGYISDESGMTINLSGDGIVPVQAGVIPTSTVSTALTRTDNSNALSGSSTDGTPSITYGATTSVDARTMTEGYMSLQHLSSMQVPITNSNPEVTDTRYIKPGSVTVTPSLSSTFTNVNSQDTDTVTDEINSTPILLSSTSSLPAGADYFTITASTSANVNAGWVKSEFVNTSATATYYLPQAVVEWVTDTQTNEEYFQITSGGYLPSGTLTDITHTAMSYATVGLSYSNDFATNTSGNYTITVSKNLSAGGAGYISGTQGTLDNNTVSVARGAVTVSEGTNNDIVLEAAPVWNSTTNKYDFTGTGTTITNVVVGTEGYIKQADVSGLDSNHTYLTISKDATLSLNKATIAVNSNSVVNVVAGNATNVTTDTSSDYWVAPVIDNSHNTVGATGTAGYLESTDFGSISLTVANAPTDKIYIKQGTLLTNVNGADTLSSPNLVGTLNGNNSYTVSLASYTISVSGTLAEGYYGSAESSVTGLATVSQRSVTINAAAATVSADHSSNEISGTGITLHSSDSGSGSYAAINASAAVIFNSDSNGDPHDPALISTVGYLADPSQITIADISGISAATKYVALYTDGDQTVGQTSAEDPENITTNASTLVDVGGKYSASDVRVTIASHTMGTEVAYDLTRLKQRLAGLTVNAAHTS